MIIINKQTLNEVKGKAEDPSSRSQAIEDIKQMIYIKQTLLWRADAGTCCGRGGASMAAMLNREIALLNDALEAVEHDDSAKAVALLDRYDQMLEKEYGGCYPEHCQT